MRKGSFARPADVYCDMTTNGGGWNVIQRNKKDSAVDFNKNWTDYEQGFGGLKTEFWYGLEAIHCLTQTGQWEMRVDYQKLNKTWSYFHYNQFSVGSASEEYPLTVGGFNAHPLNMMKFSTADNDNDNSHSNCAAHNKDGWWYNSCSKILITGQRLDFTGNGAEDALFVEMKIRPKDCITN